MARRAYGSINEEVLSDGTVKYRARIRVGTGEKPLDKRFDSRDDAERWLLDVSLNVRNGEYKKRQIDNPTVAEWVAQYIERGASRWRGHEGGATVTLYDRALRLYIRPKLGKRKLRDLTPAMVQAWIDGQHDLSPSSVHLHVQVLSGACREAVRLGVIANNPVTPCRLPKATRTQRVMWDREQVRKVYAAVRGDPYWHAVYRVMLSTGMRPGELRALAWADVGADAITIRRTVTRVNGKEGIGATTKGGRARVVAVPASVVTALKAWRIKQEPGEELVFAAHRGGMLDGSTWRHHHRAFCEGAGVPVIRLHDLRHVAATSMLAAGVPLKTVSDRLGHAGIQVTADIYLHTDDAMQMSAAERLEAWIEGTTTSPSEEAENRA